MSAEQELIFVNYQIQSISPTRLIPAESLGLNDDDIPAELHRLLRERTFDRERLRPFDRLRKRFEKRLLQTAARGDLGFGLPRSEAQGVIEYARECQKEYYQERDALLRDLPKVRERVLDRVDERFGSYPWVDRLREAVRASIPDEEHLRRQIVFRFAATRVEGVVEDDCHDLQNIKRGYADNLIDEIVRGSADVLGQVTECETAERGVAPRTLKRVVEMGAKVKRLAFIDPRLKGLHEGLSRLERNVIQSAIVGEKRVPLNELGELTAALHLLSDARRLKERLEAGEPLMWKASSGRQMGAPAARTKPQTNDTGAPSRKQPKKAGRAFGRIPA